MQPLRQCAALPCVDIGGAKQVLLITTRGTGSWTIPKGWRKRGIKDPELAAKEAFEEAGVAGNVGNKPIGSYEYVKRLHWFSWVRCRVSVYLLQVDRQFLTWPEQSSRKSAWMPPGEAAGLVRHRQLADLLRTFA